MPVSSSIPCGPLPPPAVGSPAPPGSVLVAVSGGVDSAVAAWLLREQGWEVIGATLRLFSPGDPRPLHEGFTSPETVIRRAEAVCRLLGIAHRVIDGGPEFRDKVLTPFFLEYDTGLTPNPCVWCNPQVKWNLLQQVARETCCTHVATGHYARTRAIVGGRVGLFRGIDPAKDQSYVLYRLDQATLARTLFPLGYLRKEEVRRLARHRGIPACEDPESQDLCFLPRGALAACLSRNTSPAPGPVVDRHGTFLGTHKGLPFYTVGQRKGLGLAVGEPIYVIRKEPWANRLVVGPRQDLWRRSFSVGDLRWVSMAPPAPGQRVPVQVELRFRSRPVPGEVLQHEGDTAQVTLDAHEQSVAPGQSAVWYQGDLLLGGGVIHPDAPHVDTRESSTAQGPGGGECPAGSFRGNPGR